MQTIISLLNLQADKIEDKKYADMFKEGEDRIRSMALIHEQLYQTKDFANIDFGEYIKILTDGLLTSSGVNTNKIRLNIEAKDVFFDIENAIPCGLIINELVTNSLKHAFPQGKEGEISINLRSTNEDEFELSVSDNGIGISEDLDVEQTSTMGLQLVKVLAENQLDGKIDLDRTEGTQFNIKFKRTTHKPRI
jgi:two-component sensor histidine kinase